MNGEVLGSGDGLQVLWIVSLEPAHKGYRHSRGEKWIFAVRLLTSSPARIASDIDVGSPEIQPFQNVAPALADCLVMFRSAFGTDRACQIMNQGKVESRGESDRLRKNCGYTRSGDAMQASLRQS